MAYWIDNDEFGWSVAAIGDMDGDGVVDVAVGAHDDDDGGTDRGALWILFLETTGLVKSHQKISDTEGSFNGVLDNGDDFGGHIAAVNFMCLSPALHALPNTPIWVMRT